MMSFALILFEWKDFFRSGSRQARREALRYEKLSGREKEMADWNARRKLVSYVYDKIPYYRDYYDKCGFHPSQLQLEQDWERVPVLEKEAIRSSANRLLLPEASRRKLVPTSTGGSTGTPLKLYKDKDIHFEAVHWRALKWYGCHPADSVGIVNRRVPATRSALLLNRFLWWPTRRCYLDASSVTAENILYFLKEIRRNKIVYLTGYCGSLEHIADYILAHDVKLNSLKLVWSTTNPLKQYVRKKMETAFGCPVMDQYGSCELPNIAVQKSGEDFLTVNSDYVHVDLINSSGRLITENGFRGDILITDLHSRLFPLVKYQLGDRSQWCCSFLDSADGFPKLAPVEGRISDAVILPDGTFIDGAYLTTICDNYTDIIDSYQICQTCDYNLILKVVLKFSKTSEEPRLVEIVDALKKKVAGKVNLQVSFCDSIPDERGKKRYIISEIAAGRKA